MIEQLGIGARVGDCVLVRQLGRGGMGAVYLARHVELGVDYALKVQHLRNARSSRERAERFRREAQALAKVDRHPGIVGIHHYGLVEGTDLAYCLLDLVEGQDLSEHLNQGGLPVERVLTWGEQVARALAHVHAAGIVHRDLKPANVLVRDADQRALLTDFGLARDESEREKLTVTGQVIGTAFYMAPEQVTAQRELIGPKVDVFALGAVLYEMLTGEPPFTGGNLFELTAQIVNAEAARIPAVSPDLDQLVQTCLAKEPEQRPTALEVAEGLARIGRDEPLGWSRRSSSLWRFQRAVRRGEPRALAGILAATALVVSGAAIGAYQHLVARPAAAAQATQVEFAGWRAKTLDPCAFGLADGPPPARAELEAWVARLEPDAEARVELRAYLRWLDLRDRGASALLGGSVPDRVVDGLILIERGELAQAAELLAANDLNGSLPARLARRTVESRRDPETYFASLEQLEGAERALAARHAAAAATLLWTQTATQVSEGGALTDVRRRLLAQLPAFLPEGSDALARAKRMALESSAPGWSRRFAPLAEAERVLGSLTALVQTPPYVRIGSQIEAVCEAVLARLCTEAEGRLRAPDGQVRHAIRRLLACERLIHKGVLPKRWLPDRFAAILKERVFTHTKGTSSPDLLLTCVRYTIVNPAKDLAKLLSEEETRKLRARKNEDLGAAFLLLCRRLIVRVMSPRALSALVDEMEALLANDLSPWVAPRYLARFNYDLAYRLMTLGTLVPARARALARRAWKPLDRYQAHARAHLPVLEDDLLDSYTVRAWAAAQAVRRQPHRARAEVWDAAIEVFRGRLDDPTAPAARARIARYELAAAYHRAALEWMIVKQPDLARARAEQALVVLGPRHNKRLLRDALRKLLKRIGPRDSSD